MIGKFAGLPALNARPGRALLVSFLSGVLASAAYPPFYLLPALFAGVWVLFGLASTAPTWRRAAWQGSAFGFGLNVGGLYWLTNAVLVGGAQFWWAVPLATPGCALVLAPFVGLPAVKAQRFRGGWGGILIFSASWTLFDMGRVFLFSGFPWNPIGADLTFPGWPGTILIQAASVIGVDGLTFCLLVTSAAPLRARGASWMLIGFWSAVAAAGFFRLHHLDTADVKNPVIVLVQNNVSEDHILNRDETSRILQQSLTMTQEGLQQARARYPDQDVVYAWPESGFPGLLDEAPLAREAIARAAHGAWGIIGSDRRDRAGHWFNSAMALNPAGEIIAVYDKSRLVPFGEYQPALLPFNIMPGQFTPGPGLRTWSLPSIGRVGPLVCYEVIFSGQITAAERPDWLLNLTNDAWFGASAGPWQHLMALRVRAVEEGLPIAQVANTGITAIYDASGREVERIPQDRQTILVAPLPPPVKKTLFATSGRSIPIFICCMAFLIGALMIKKAGKLNSSEGEVPTPSIIKGRSRSHE